ncbi:uncharacterized protein CTRU02_200189 [Colletotrichum truncatum]|uniref:Uncharacterized protein n=1 Tax=Colletotrichum truncatum TaxID=5467 RepID=A0ACC3ZEE4_COLTU|nr:uncharacterized protein CTRU02_05066 [Colletotrichum truncatum]KAF6794865.1 hypothetical protein CTRU02_05066 [Colletotrichum truncatum]
MAEPFELLGLIGVILQIFETGAKYGLNWEEAPKEARAFKTELESLRTVLSETNANLVLNAGFKAAFEGRKSAVPSHDVASPEYSTANLLLACRKELETVVEKLTKTAEGDRLGWSRLKGAFNAERTHSAVEDLHRRCQALNSLVLIDSAETLTEVRTANNALEDQRRTKEEAQILNWLTPSNHGPQLKDNLDQRELGTGHWLLESPEYQGWVKADKQTLFCPGMPGAGKTILSSIVIDDLHRKFQKDSSVGVAFMFCNFRLHDEQTLNELLASLLKQLSQGQKPFPELVSELYNKHKGRSTRPSTDEMMKSLQAVGSSLSKAYIVIDALDECSAELGCRDKLISAILHLQKVCNINLFATSRFTTAIAASFEVKVELEIKATESDVRRYLDSHMSQLPMFVKKNTDLQEEIKTQITKSAHGMFLLARLHLQSLKGKRSPKAIKSTLAKLCSGPDAYDIAYEEAMRRIESQIEDQTVLAKDALSWIVCARRPLTTVELQHALAIEKDTAELDEDNVTDLEDVVSACAGLVSIDKESDVIRLVHHTAQEYFERTRSRWLPGAENLLASSCITYLTFKTPEESSDYYDIFTYRTLDKFSPLYDYAARNWGYHTRELSVPCQDTLSFLQNQLPYAAASFELVWEIDVPYQLGGYPTSENISGLHIAAYFGLKSAFINLLEVADPQTGLNIKDSRGFTPLVYGILGQSGDFLRFLLALYQDECDKATNFKNWRPIFFATATGNEAVVDSLIQTNRINIDPIDCDGRTPLTLAAKKGHVTIVKRLMDTNQVDVDSRDRLGRTPLSYAAGSDCIEIVRLLVQTNRVDLNSRDDHGRSPLSYAAEESHVAVAKYLLETNRVDANSRGRRGRSPLSRGRTPLSYASEWGKKGICEMLLQTGKVDADSRDFRGRSPLSYASDEGHEDACRLLLQTGKVEPDSRDQQGRSPLSYASEAGYDEICDLLIQTGKVDVNSRDNEGHGCLTRAASGKYEDASRCSENVLKVIILQSSEANVDLPDSSGRTPLSYAAQSGHFNFIKTLMATGKVDPNSADVDGLTPLFWATHMGRQEVVEYLLCEGKVDASLFRVDSEGETPLDLAVRVLKPSHPITKLLAERMKAVKRRNTEELA